jgi:PAS domain S-box-containing protein
MTEAFQHPDSNREHDAKDDLRVRAEARASSGTPGEPTDALFHELRVHQIELEMQNEELRRAQADLEASRARYFDLYDLAPVGYCTLDAASVVLEANLTAARLFGVTKDQLVGEPLTDYLHRDSQDAFYRHRRHLQDTLAPQAFELLFRRSPNASFWAWVEVHVARGSKDAFLCRVAFTDITLLKQAGSGGPAPAH